MTSIPVQELEYHYSPSRWSHRMGPDEVINAHLETTAQGSRNSLWTLDSELEISYGDSERQKFDIFYKKNAPKKGAPILIYFHGGYWQIKEIGRTTSSFPAVPLCNAGAIVIPVGYDLAPDVSLDTILLQAKKALHLVIKLAKERQNSGIYLAGHSAGAHIAAMMLMASLSQYDAFDSDLIKGAVLISGVYDLRPLVKTSNNEALRLSETEAWRFSPLNFVQEIAHQSQHRHVVVAVGEYDPPEFRRQSGEMEQMLRNFGVKTSYLDVPDVDHFNIVEKLSESKYILTQECIRLMGL
ncbi:kynurenine formamidase-like isoform X2 [Biomphalaria glabrata]|nr:kynurenine formamidase-like isoform X2 [Biomphalaria glabrata]XP_055898042.1 kynurenine formamidase-like isoform X2 [Biomphalaria glabrata]XP_055898043.1 kynurenine formamidase-like isoform X2 [Biomphalaria glabrata]XP_055898044.1 kynurenine formamidase-like isoform X2 [Biomphalaria glabrata]XP_055898045.1 kynurenine formamidase-like isoform X2 [Biomphalaria glabrata]